MHPGTIDPAPSPVRPFAAPASAPAEDQRQPPLARLSGVRACYGATVALDGVDLAVHPGEVVALLGPNGAGKTTAIALLTGLRRASAGSVALFDGDPRETARRVGLGVMLQDGGLPDVLTVAELVAQWSACYPAPRPVEESIALAGLEAQENQRYGRLSGGQRRRVQFALAVCGRPRLLVVDEPTTGLDVEARRQFWTVLRRLIAEGAGLLLTTHYLEEADALADRIVVLAGGRIVAQGPPEAIKQRAGSALVSCRTGLAPDTLATWPEVERVGLTGTRVELATGQPEALLRRLLEADPGLADLQVSRSSLDDALIHLTREAA